MKINLIIVFLILIQGSCLSQSTDSKLQGLWQGIDDPEYFCMFKNGRYYDFSILDNKLDTTIYFYGFVDDCKSATSKSDLKSDGNFLLLIDEAEILPNPKHFICQQLTFVNQDEIFLVKWESTQTVSFKRIKSFPKEILELIRKKK